MGQITDLIQAAHQNAINKGWWDEDRTFGEIIALIQSEVAEALEDFRNGRAVTEVWYENKKMKTRFEDPITPDCKPCGIPSELADIFIRIYDACGRYGWAEQFQENIENGLPEVSVSKDLPFAENLTIINGWLTDAYREKVPYYTVYYLALAAADTRLLAEHHDIDLDRAIAEKMAYNATRPQRHGGKVL